VTLSTSPSFASLGPVLRLALIQQQHPGIEIRLDASDRVLDLQAEDVDMAIRSVPTGKLSANVTLLIDDVLATARLRRSPAIGLPGHGDNAGRARAPLAGRP
jgi:DNA-binding transcriptional LysR family regulator